MNSKSNLAEKKETKVKMTMTVKASIFAAALGLACLLPATTHAQADVSPDFYEFANTETTVITHQVQVALPSPRSRQTFRGTSRCLMRCAARARI